MSQTVLGIFDDADEARRAVRELVENGFDEDNIDYARGSEAYTDDEKRKEHDNGISRFFRNLFGNDDEGHRYERVAKRGCIVTVHAQSTEEARRASELLDEYGAVDIDEKDREYDMERGKATDEAYRAKDETYFENAGKESRKIPVIEENLKIDKKVVEKGGVRLRSRIVEKPVEETIRLREEHVHVERTKVDRPVGGNELETIRDKVRRKEVEVENIDRRTDL